MKRVTTRLSLILMVILLLPQKAFSDNVLPLSHVPQEIKTYVQKHFPQQVITRAEKETEWRSVEYSIWLNKRVKIEFDKGLQVKEVESDEPLPTSVIPGTIASYVKRHYPHSQILSWKKEKRIQEIELDNHLDLVFDLKGNFRRVDH